MTPIMPPIAPAVTRISSLLILAGLPNISSPAAEIMAYMMIPHLIPEIIPLWRRYLPQIKAPENAPINTGNSEI